MDNITLIIKDYHIEHLGIGNILKCLITALSINDDTVIECYPTYIYGQYDTILEERFIYNPNIPTIKTLEKVYTCRFLIMTDEVPYQVSLPNEEWYNGGLENPKFYQYFSLHTQIDWNYDPSMIHNMVKTRIFKNIDTLKFKQCVTHEVEQFIGLFKGSSTLGVSIRTWKSKHETNIMRPYTVDIYKHKLLEVLRAHSEVDTIVLSIDNRDYIEPYISYCNELNIRYIILDKSDNMNDIQYAIIKALTLSHCNYFIGNRISTFSELVFWFSKCRVKVYTVF